MGKFKISKNGEVTVLKHLVKVEKELKKIENQPTNDPRYRGWQLNEKSTKAEIFEHLDNAHEKQAKRDCYRFMANFHYFCRLYSKERLLRIHAAYHREVK